MQLVKISELTPHPRNNEFFDDVTGQRWDEFLESIKTSGVIEPIVITEEKVIVSGHQRVRACKELGIEEIMAEVKLYDGDDKRVLKDLIETNVRQRGTIGGSDSQIVARVEALKEWYGVHQGRFGHNVKSTNGAFYSDQQDEKSSTMKIDDILKILGLTKKQYQTAQKIAENTIPEIQQLIEDGTVSRRTVSDLIAKLSPEDQQKLLDSLPDNVKFSAKTIEAYIDEIRSEAQAEAASTAATIQQNADKLLGQIDELKRENNALKDGYVIPEDAQEQIDKLQLDSRKYYESWQSSKKRVDQLEDMLDKAIKAKATAEAAAKGGDAGILSLQNQLDEMEKELEAEKRKADDFEFQLSEKVEEIKNLERRAKDGFMRSAITPAAGSEEANERQIRQLMDTIQITIGTFIEGVNKVMMQANLIPSIPDHILGALCHTSEDAEIHAHRLWNELIKNVSPESYMSQGDDADDDDDYFDEIIVENENTDYSKHKKDEFTMEELGLDY